MTQPSPESPPAEALDIMGTNSCPTMPTYRIQQPRGVVVSTKKAAAQAWTVPTANKVCANSSLNKITSSHLGGWGEA